MKIFKNQKGFGLIEGLLIVIALSLVTGVSYYVYSQNNVKKDDLIATQTITKPNEEPKVPDLIDYEKIYPPNGVKIESRQDIQKLKDASDSLKNFISSLTTNEPKYEYGCDYPTSVYVRKIYKDMFASGSVGACGGASLVWKNESEGWKSVLAGQDAPLCKDVIKHEIPKEIIEECYDTNVKANGGLVKNPI